jgi:hypothetical protein
VETPFDLDPAPEDRTAPERVAGRFALRHGWVSKSSTHARNFTSLNVHSPPILAAPGTLPADAMPCSARSDFPVMASAATILIRSGAIRAGRGAIAHTFSPLILSKPDISIGSRLR